MVVKLFAVSVSTIAVDPETVTVSLVAPTWRITGSVVTPPTWSTTSVAVKLLNPLTEQVDRVSACRERNELV